MNMAWLLSVDWTSWSSPLTIWRLQNSNDHNAHGIHVFFIFLLKPLVLNTEWVRLEVCKVSKPYWDMHSDLDFAQIKHVCPVCVDVYFYLFCKNLAVVSSLYFTFFAVLSTMQSNLRNSNHLIFQESKDTVSFEETPNWFSISAHILNYIAISLIKCNLIYVDCNLSKCFCLSKMLHHFKVMVVIKIYHGQYCIQWLDWPSGEKGQGLN